MLAHLGAPNQLFHTPAGTAFADIPVKDHQETWPIRSKRFRSWLRRGYYEATGEAGSAAAVRSALDLLVERFQNSNHMGSPKGPHFAVASPNTATDQNHGIDRLVQLSES
jgi:hypothetical protein